MNVPLKEKYWKKKMLNEDVNLSTTVYVFEDVRGRFCTIETFLLLFEDFLEV